MAGRPATTGPSAPVNFRARTALAARLEQRRTYPDIRQDPFYGGPVPKGGKNPGIGTVACRDLVVFYGLMDAELAEAALELDHGQALTIVQAMHGVATDAVWIISAPELLAGNIEDDIGDDEIGPDQDRKQLAALVRSWPRLRALAVAEAALAAISAATTDADFDDTLVRVGLLPKGRR